MEQSFMVYLAQPCNPQIAKRQIKIKYLGTQSLHLQPPVVSLETCDVFCYSIICERKTI